MRSRASTATRRPIGPPQSCTTTVAPCRSSSSKSASIASVWRSYVYHSRSSGLSERPKPGRSGAMQRKPASRTGGMTLRHRNDHVGSPWKNTTGGPEPSSRWARRSPSQSRNCEVQGKSGRAMGGTVTKLTRGYPPGMTTPESASKVALGRLSIDTIRTLSMDAVEKANSGHPGMPMAMAPAAYLLYTRFMKHNPKNPAWPDRDRFVLSAGHGSMLLYSVLHLSGYELSMDELKAFRQWGSLTPGHPERDKVHVTPGVEVTTGPLGQGFANGVGMAIAERFLRAKFGEEVQSHRVFAICSDGDLQEGIASEAASLAGHLRLGRLVYLYDDNSIQLDGPTAEAFSEDVPKRFEAYGWHTRTVDDVNDLDALADAIQAGIDEEERPTLISVKTIIGWPAPNKQGTSKAHGSPLGEDEVRATKEALGWDPDAHFVVPDGVYEHFSQVERGERAQAEGGGRFDSWHGSHAELAREWDAG